MQKLRGLLLASVTLCAGGAQAFQLNTHAPTIHQVNPQSLPPGATMKGGSGYTNETYQSGTGGSGRPKENFEMCYGIRQTRAGDAEGKVTRCRTIQNLVLLCPQNKPCAPVGS